MQQIGTGAYMIDFDDLDKQNTEYYNTPGTANNFGPRHWLPYKDPNTDGYIPSVTFSGGFFTLGDTDGVPKTLQDKMGKNATGQHYGMLDPVLSEKVKDKKTGKTVTFNGVLDISTISGVIVDTGTKFALPGSASTNYQPRCQVEQFTSRYDPAVTIKGSWDYPGTSRYKSLAKLNPIGLTKVTRENLVNNSTEPRYINNNRVLTNSTLDIALRDNPETIVVAPKEAYSLPADSLVYCNDCRLCIDKQTDINMTGKQVTEVIFLVTHKGEDKLTKPILIKLSLGGYAQSSLQEFFDNQLPGYRLDKSDDAIETLRKHLVTLEVTTPTPKKAGAELNPKSKALKITVVGKVAEELVAFMPPYTSPYKPFVANSTELAKLTTPEVIPSGISQVKPATPF